ncbi:hypothetical protein IQ243_21030 [Nostocales cyanobacterium LEGE 11386]|nr:hypothetical protein [Nostocales cyanobacterium LEGE 11386]
MPEVSLYELVSCTQYLISQIALHPDLLKLEYYPDLTIGDAQSALSYLKHEIENRQQLSTLSQNNQAEPQIHPQDLRIKQIRTLLDYPLDLVKEWLGFQDARSPSQLPINKIDTLVKNMCLAWAADKFDHFADAEDSYQQQVVDAVANGTDELTAIKTWMQQVQTTKVEASL